jgi:hypothetical protein
VSARPTFSAKKSGGECRIRSADRLATLRRTQELSSALKFDKRQYLQRVLHHSFGFTSRRSAGWEANGKRGMLQNTPSVRGRSDRERRRYDGRSATACRIRVLIKEYTSALGDAARNPMTVAAIRRASELQALAEEARAAAVRTGLFDPVALARIEGIADRAVRRLDLGGKRQPDVNPFDKYVAEKAAAR